MRWTYGLLAVSCKYYEQIVYRRYYNNDCRYTLLIGKPPFETDSLKETYHKIRHNDYRIPNHISLEAKALITKLLRQDPSTRPTATEILSDPFFLSGFTPAKLPLRWVSAE